MWNIKAAGRVGACLCAVVLFFFLCGSPCRGGDYLTEITTVAAGAEHSLALTSRGHVWSWGANWAGQLGNGSAVEQDAPVPVSGHHGEGRLAGISAIAAGVEHSVALTNDGSVWTWGGNRYGQLGDGSTVARHAPVQVRGEGGEGNLDGMTAIAAGVGHTVALARDGTVWVWGRQSLHEWDDAQCLPTRVKTKSGEDLTGITAIAAGEEHTVALREDGTVWTWGINWEGTLGDGTQTRIYDAVKAKIAGCTSVAAGGRATFALKKDEATNSFAAWSWGDNYTGQLGDGTNTHRLTPVRVKGEDTAGFLTGVSRIAGGMGHTVALKDDGTVWAWGSGSRGQLGDAATSARYAPVQVKGEGGKDFLTHVTGIAAGEQHTLAVRDDGTLWAWGKNNHGQLGSGAIRDHGVPVQVRRKESESDPALVTDNAAREPIDIGSRLELFVDDYLIERLEGVELRLHRPQKLPLTENPFPSGHYMTVIKDKDVYRAYYRDNGSYKYAESRDGHEWIRHDAPLPASHNFSPFLDTNPDVAPQKRFKALEGLGTPWGIGLNAWTSPDGLQWHRWRNSVITGAPFDSQNVAFWSSPEQLYVCYYRNFRRGVRTVWRCTSPDFLEWSDPEELHPNLPGEHFYTSQTHPYFRAPHIYVALPTRFADETIGTTDIGFMTSRGGAPYHRPFKEAFIRPGLDPERWGNRANYTALNVVPTGPTEMSIFHRSGHRYVLRTDGFVSVNAPWDGGEMITKPVLFDGQELILNLSTSIRGSVRVELQTAGGKPLPGLAASDCPPIVGDSIEHVVSWKAGTDVSQYVGQPVRVRVVMKDSDVYSLRFR